jgi:hypothetical protein
MLLAIHRQRIVDAANCSPRAMFQRKRRDDRKAPRAAM